MLQNQYGNFFYAMMSEKYNARSHDNSSFVGKYKHSYKKDLSKYVFCMGNEKRIISNLK